MLTSKQDIGITDDMTAPSPSGEERITGLQGAYRQIKLGLGRLEIDLSSKLCANMIKVGSGIVGLGGELQSATLTCMATLTG